MKKSRWVGFLYKSQHHLPICKAVMGFLVAEALARAAKPATSKGRMCIVEMWEDTRKRDVEKEIQCGSFLLADWTAESEYGPDLLWVYVSLHGELTTLFPMVRYIQDAEIKNQADIIVAPYLFSPIKFSSFSRFWRTLQWKIGSGVQSPLSCIVRKLTSIRQIQAVWIYQPIKPVLWLY